MERLKKYIKAFVIIGILGGMLYGLAMSLRIGIVKGMLAGIIFGVICGGLMALVLIPLDFFLTRKLPTEALNVRQDKEIQLKENFDYVFQKCVEILKNFKVIKTVTPLKEKKIISARTKMSLLSFGENITLQFDILSQDIIKIHISSCPTFKYTLLDYGKNFKNVDLISKTIANLF